jgi:two-component system nitrogen regulation response regulator GlnG
LAGRGAGARWTVPGLTILFHPDIRRIGDCVRLVDLLDGREAAVTRLEPIFAAPGAPSGGPLAHRSVSRRKLRLAVHGGGVRLLRDADVEVVVDGTPLAAPRDFSAEEIERGVVLELGGRLVLLLHRLGPPSDPLPRFGLVGDSGALEHVRSDIGRVAGLEVPVLLRGESGTGKELVARAIQQASPRAREAFVAVNMAAVPPAIAASELFGHAPGAFTGASRGHAGYFAQADGGTLFLDEVGETPPDVQAMLLRVLESHETQPLGSANRGRVDVRVIAATESDLDADVRRGRFRESLLYRLAGYQIALPPLRERRDDIGRLLFHRLAAELKTLGEEERLSELAGSDPWLSAPLVGALARYDWPGNVRQLCNVARHLAIASRGGRPVQLDALPPGLLGAAAGPTPADAPAPLNLSAPGGARRPASEGTSDGELIAALRANGWRTSAAARQLGISRTTLYKLIDRSAAIRKAKDVSADEIRRCMGERGGDVETIAAALEVSPRGLLLRMKELRIG